MKEAKDFENKLKRIEEIVEKLEKQEMSLAETVSLFREGMKLAGECRRTLSEVEQSVAEVIGLDGDGNPETEVFKAEDD